MKELRLLMFLAVGPLVFLVSPASANHIGTCDGQFANTILSDGPDVWFGVNPEMQYIVQANPGDDELHANAVNDLICGNDGNDLIYPGLADGSWIGDPDNVVFAGSGDDDVRGATDTDDIFGFTGADHLKAGRGDDFIYGQDGYDTLKDGRGRDYMDGGAPSPDIVNPDLPHDHWLQCNDGEIEEGYTSVHVHNVSDAHC